MKDWDFQRSIASARALVQAASEHDLPAAACLRGTGLSPAALLDPNAQVSGHQEMLIARNLVRRLGHVPALGIAAGRHYHYTSIGILGFAVASSPSMKDAAEIALRYLPLTFAFASFHIEDDGREFRFVGNYASIAPDMRRFFAERDLTAVLNVQRELLPAVKVRPKRVGFAFPRPKLLQPYEEFFGVVPTFGAPRTELAIDSALMQLPLPMANVAGRRAAEEQCRRLLTLRKARGGVAEQVRDHILRDPSQLPGFEEVASALALAPRTLRRRLLDEGTTYRSLCDEVREVLAEELLSTPRLPVERVAEALGYSAASSFILAFKRWKGTPPHVYRRGLETKLA